MNIRDICTECEYCIKIDLEEIQTNCLNIKWIEGMKRNMNYLISQS